MRTWFRFLPLVLITACSGNDVKDTLGLTREAPDEYRVVTRPPLSVPPEFNLRPPAAPGEMPASQAMDQKAKAVLTGKSADDANTFKLQPENTVAAPVKLDAPSAKTTPESNFLQKAGATEADPNVRAAIEREKAAKAAAAEEEKSWWDLSILPEKKEPVVDASGEAERLKKNQQTGKPVTEGETPDTAGGKDTGVLGRILGY